MTAGRLSVAGRVRWATVGVLLALMGCDNAPIGPADSGIDYVVTNRCDKPVMVTMGPKDRVIALAIDETYTIHTLDRDPDGGFVVRSIDGGGEVRFSPGVATFDLASEWCPTA